MLHSLQPLLLITHSKNSRANYREMAPPTQSNGNKESHVKIPKIKFTKLFINGEFVDSLSGKTFESIDPRNEEVIARVAEGDKEDVDLAVKAARQAFDNGPWPRFSGTERRRILLKLADLIEENAEELAALDTLNAGKLFSEGKNADVPSTAGYFRYYAGAAYTLCEPIGVVGLIIPWNYPAQIFGFKVAAALAAGCTVIVKPAEQTPLSALYYAHLANLAGVPDGVLNVITGFGSIVGAAISSHMDIDKVSFTGSTEVGRQIMQAAATSNLKPVSLELGGKCPFIVFDDVDVDKVSDLGLAGATYNKGEICAAGSRVFVQEGIYEKFVEKVVTKARVFVQEGIYEKFVEKVVTKAKAKVVGDPFDPNVQQGPQASKKQYEKILSYIEQGKREGATLLTGGKPLDREGYFIHPTIFTDVTDDMLIAKDEIFGPVMPILKFKTVEEVIKRANDTKYGLAAGIMTNDWNIANTVSRSIKAGSIWINCYMNLDADCPFGGYKMSGFDRDMGMEGLYKYLQVKSVATPVYNSLWL